MENCLRTGQGVLENEARAFTARVGDATVSSESNNMDHEEKYAGRKS